MAIEINIEDLNNGNTNLPSISTMYQDYFLDYASYVILERAVPHIHDGLKPVQRRILHSMREKEDGRYHKVANLIGHTMQYHPHGDAAIGDALVNLGQKDLLIDTQGNWGDYRTGDSAAAARYIEARLNKFALFVAFNKQITDWHKSYDGRNDEPITLPMKFPLLLALGVEGIAVGLSTKILPHNFIELIEGSIAILSGENVKIFPDFLTGGMINISEYQGGKRGGRVKVRAKIDIKDKNTLLITEIPYSTTTSHIAESIIKANDKGQIKIKKIADNTAKNVEIAIDLYPGTSPEITIDALYSFTDCEISISPNACVIIDNRPEFLTVEEILHISTERTKKLLGLELEIKKAELLEKWHLSSLEKIFIEKRIYRQIEEAESFEIALKIIEQGLKVYISTPTDRNHSENRLLLNREITQEDILKLTEIKIKRISKFNEFKHGEMMLNLEKEIEQVTYDLTHLTDFAISYFEEVLQKFGSDKKRKTVITSFESISATRVVANNAKLYVDREGGFVGYGMKKDEYICDCSDISEVIIFRKDGNCKIVKISEKLYVGKDILHIDLWEKGDDRTTYHLVYLDGKTGRTMIKRFNIIGVQRDKDYLLISDHPLSKISYFSAHKNGESETIKITLTPSSKAKIKVFDFDFGSLETKGRTAKGNILTRYSLRSISQKEIGASTLGPTNYWLDENTGRLNREERGKSLGQFTETDKLIILYSDGSYETKIPNEHGRIDMNNLQSIEKFNPNAILATIYYDGYKDWTVVKRFMIETNQDDQRYNFLTDHPKSQLLYITNLNGIQLKAWLNPHLSLDIDLDNFVATKGWKALGNKLCERKATSIKETGRIVIQNKTNDLYKSEEE